jgi:hypothetical protein
MEAHGGHNMFLKLHTLVALTELILTLVLMGTDGLTVGHLASAILLVAHALQIIYGWLRDHFS